jgi:hypothetical protein
VTPRAGGVRHPGETTRTPYAAPSYPIGGVLLGWTGDREIVLPVVSEDTTILVAQPVSGEESREVTRVEGTSSYGVGRLQLASALLSDLEVREPGDPDRGPLPAGLRITLALLLGLGVAVYSAGRIRRRTRPRGAEQVT